MKCSSVELAGKQLRTKRNVKQISKTIKRNSFGMPPFPEKTPKSLANLTKDTEIAQNLTKFVLLADKKDIFNISAQTEET